MCKGDHNHGRKATTSASEGENNWELLVGGRNPDRGDLHSGPSYGSGQEGPALRVPAVLSTDSCVFHSGYGLEDVKMSGLSQKFAIKYEVFIDFFPQAS